ncbi:hypothetical protein FJQ98_16205 [Lysinibacillus agricola]|uniref:CDI immunity protein domain-containing protein n=1 Tax=Lysinibacillus agricola TaxID=2590012 RepID=A0ABX7APE2_9BACI|nr:MULTISPECIES: hypothetical protein [Lysinibacillus]KOS61518.1 hypothetical protein AN161_18180 [Lysinibacillus sp. FJAT-14222]QQP10788.1 hypothetical protein FJQ98_16205 [Lysinibacillus agricola]
MFKFECGDSIKFGEEYCKEFEREDLISKTIMMTPQYFEEDNGIYVYTSTYAGIYDKENKEAHSIYHLFGNDFEYFMDCELVKGSNEDKKKYEEIINLHNKVLEDEAARWIEFTSEKGF